MIDCGSCYKKKNNASNDLIWKWCYNIITISHLDNCVICLKEKKNYKILINII